MPTETSDPVTTLRAAAERLFSELGEAVERLGELDPDQLAVVDLDALDEMLRIAPPRPMPTHAPSLFQMRA